MVSAAHTHIRITRSVFTRYKFTALLGALLVILALAWFSMLELRGLYIPDEGRYAEIPREMLATGDWITPRLNGLKYFEKPPLQYWLTAATFAAFGEDEWTARLAPALLGFAAVLMAGFTARRLWSGGAGILALAILGSNWSFYLGGQYLTLDMTLSALLGIALCAFLLAQRDEAEDGERLRWMLLAWLACALATLTKGLVGLVLPGLALLAYTVAMRDWRLWRQLHLGTGLLLYAVVTVPWFVLVQARNPEFFHFFFIREHLQRFALDTHHRPGAWWYYLPILLLGLLPWTPAVLQAAWAQVRPGGKPNTAARFRADWFCAVWALVVILFFSASHSKLPAYVLPAFPALALLTAGRLREQDLAKALKWSGGCLVATGLLIAAGLSYLPHWRKFAELGADAGAALPLLYPAAACLLAAGIGAVAMARRERPGKALAALCLGSFAFWGLVFVFMYRIDAQYSAERLIEQLTPSRAPYHPQLPFYSVGQFDHSLPFYLQRTVTLVDVRNELGPGIDAEPGKAIASLDEFRARWRALPGQAFAVMTPEQYVQFAGEGLPMHKMLSDHRLMIVSRRPGIPSPS